jgi:hypothetical protein
MSDLARRTHAEESADDPQVIMCVPLGLPAELDAHAPITIKARGLRLDGVTEVRCTTPGIACRLVKQEKASIPAGLNAARVGDTWVEFELTWTTDSGMHAMQQIELEFVSPQGHAKYSLPLAHHAQSILEVGPNESFSAPPTISIPQVVIGQIERPYDVDVFAVDLVAGQAIRIEVQAEQFGSGLDALLAVVADTGSPIAMQDDASDSRDVTLDVVVPNDGRYYLVVQDANDGGGDAHPYRLVVKQAVEPVSFVRDVAPILLQHCTGCHGARKSEGGYRVDRFTDLISAGDSGAAGFVAHDTDQSESFRRITSDDPAERMPLDGQPLSDAQQSIIRRWIEEGCAFDGVDRIEPLISQIPPLQHDAAPDRYPGTFPITAVAFSHDGTRLFVAGYHEVLVIDPAAHAIVHRIGNLPERVSQIATHPTADQIAVAAANPGRWGEVRLLGYEGDVQQVLAVRLDTIHDVAFRPQGDRLAVADSDSVVSIYSTSDGKRLREITHHLDWVLAVSWSADGTKLVTGSRDKTAKVHDAASGQLLASYSRHDAPVRGVLFHPTGEEIYSLGENHRWDRWTIEDASLVRDMGLGAQTFRMRAAGEWFVVPVANQRVHVMKLSEADRVHELHAGSSGAFLCADVHPGSQRVAAGTDDGRIVLWDLESGKLLADFPGHPREVTQATAD